MSYKIGDTFFIAGAVYAIVEIDTILEKYILKNVSDSNMAYSEYVASADVFDAYAKPIGLVLEYAGEIVEENGRLFIKPFIQEEVKASR